MGELYECANCNRIGPLNERGKCDCCGSSAVVSIERVELVNYRTEPRAPSPIMGSLGGLYSL
jgi:hypothetical protein